MDDLEWQLEQARWNLEYWDRKYAEANKAVRKATIRLVFMAMVLLAQWTLAFIFLPFGLALSVIVLGIVFGTGVHHLQEHWKRGS